MATDATLGCAQAAAVPATEKLCAVAPEGGGQRPACGCASEEPAASACRQCLHVFAEFCREEMKRWRVSAWRRAAVVAGS